DFAGGDEAAACPAGRGRERIVAADEDEFGLGMAIEEGPAGRQDDRRPVVAAHAIDCNAHRSAGALGRGVCDGGSPGAHCPLVPAGSAAEDDGRNERGEQMVIEATWRLAAMSGPGTMQCRPRGTRYASDLVLRTLRPR